VAWLWVAIALVVVALVAVVPRKRSWGPVTYSRRSFVGGRHRMLGVLLFVALVVLVAIAITH
jgi:hypothetical protein